VTLLWHIANFTPHLTIKHSELKCLLLASNFFHKEIGIYVLAVCFIPLTGDLKWVMKCNFHDTCSEHSVHLRSFWLCQDTACPDCMVMAFQILSRIVCCLGHGYVIWYCVVSSKLLEPMYLTHRHTLLILYMCCCVEAYLNPLTPELNPSVQCCLARYLTGDFASWTMHIVNICVKKQQIHQLFIQFINYVRHVSALHCHPQGAFLVPSERCSIEEQSIEYCGWVCCV
jgi:hypothetical protein